MIPNDENLIGMKFGRLTVVRFVDKVGYGKRYELLCECGNLTTCYINNVKRGLTKSCGCLHSELFKSITTTHGKTHTRLYSIWTNMKTRCTNKNVADYKNYGGRGISVCSEWSEDFEKFQSWAESNGYTDELTIERIDFNDGYNPNNCTWIEGRYQSRNRRGNLLVTFGKETKTMREWCITFGISYKGAHQSIARKNITPKQSIEEQIEKHYVRCSK